MLRLERTSNIIDTYVWHESGSMFAKNRVWKTFRHYISKLTVCIDVSKIINILFAPVTNNVVLDVNMFGSLSAHIECSTGRVICGVVLAHIECSTDRVICCAHIECSTGRSKQDACSNVVITRFNININAAFLLARVIC